MIKGSAYFTYDPKANAYYFGPNSGKKLPAKTIEVTAIVDLADDGTLVGIELIDTNEIKPPTEI